MATWYVNSAAVGTGAGTSWANACTTLAAAITLSSAGDDFNVLSTHAETSTAAIALAFKGTVGSWNRVFSCTNTHTPAQAADLLAGASVSAITTSSLTISISGFVYFYGVTFNANATGGIIHLGRSNASTAAETSFKFENCALSAANSINGGNGVGGAKMDIELDNTTVSAVNGLTLQSAFFYWKNTAGAIVGTVPTNLFNLTAAGAPCYVECDGVDLSAAGSGKTLFAASTARTIGKLVNCRLGASVTVSATPIGQRVYIDLDNSDSGATGYRQERYMYQGTLTTETTVVNTASDGTQTIAWKVATTANTKRFAPFETFSIIQWVDTTGGSPKTATMQCVTDTNTDATALTNADIWMEAQVLDNASYPLSGIYTSAPATQLTAGSTLTSGTWATTTGMTTPDKRQMSVTFTNQFKGWVRFTVKVARASLTTLRIDPAVVIA